ncbi:MAG: lipopolysaccharide heptosyltransferase I, partial [Gammaproteobacteria bacterium]|nr:lipopolysaccharide heptosyltransferase I [Gammaproteobacteria bacterium]
MKVLLVKTSSLGDVIHMLPALTDAGRAISDIQFDWVVEEGFSEIPTMHPLVNRVIPVAIRRWRKNPVKALMSSQWKSFVKALRETKYDYVVDAQGLIKSAVITRMAKGLRVGLNKPSLTESLAAFAYQKKVAVDLKEHAVFRMRSILAQALDYPLPETPADYSLGKEKFPKDSWND